MSTTEGSRQDVEKLTARITAIEEWMMHCDHLLETLNGVVVSVQDRLDALQLSVDRIAEITRTLSAHVIEEETAEVEEKPPHY